jgi:hypothetical protein
MSSFNEIETAVRKLARQELLAFRDWLYFAPIAATRIQKRYTIEEPWPPKSVLGENPRLV